MEVGKQADVLVLDAADYRQVMYEFGGSIVAKVIKDGRAL